MSYVHRTMIVAAAAVPAARALLGAFPSAQGMLSVPLSPTGKEPATHYVSAGPVGADLAGLMPLSAWERSESGEWVRVSHDAGQPGVVVAAADQAGAAVTLAQVQGIFAACDVTAGPFDDAADRLGLRVVVEVAE